MPDFRSKKFIVYAITTAITVGMLIAGYSIEVALVAGSTGGTYIIGQGIADKGKEAAKIAESTTLADGR